MHASRGKASLFFLAAVAFTFAALPVAAQGFGSRGGDISLHGVPPSVTSPGFGGHPGFHGVPPSVTSPGFGDRHFRIHSRPFNNRHRRSGFINPYYGAGYYIPYDYPYDYGDYDVMSPGVDDTMEEDYERPGPTIFDSHGVGARDYPRPESRREDDYRSERNSESAPERSAEPEPPADQSPTVLVFKDGRQVEVVNYAIVGATLYDLSNGRSKKVALAELDLGATVKQNDDRGVEFKLPAGVKAD